MGADHLHVAVDDAARLAHAEVLPAQDGPPCAAFPTRSLSWFAGLGIPTAAPLLQLPSGNNVMGNDSSAACAIGMTVVYSKYENGHFPARRPL